MKFLANLGVMPLAYACLALLLALTASNIGWMANNRAKNATIAELNKDVGANQQASAVSAGLVAKWKNAAEFETGKVRACHLLLQTEELDNQVAIAKAQAARAAIDADFAAFQTIWNNVTGVCTTALANMQHACERDIPSY